MIEFIPLSEDDSEEEKVRCPNCRVPISHEFLTHLSAEGAEDLDVVVNDNDYPSFASTTY
jgi:hypothetical protein